MLNKIYNLFKFSKTTEIKDSLSKLTLLGKLFTKTIGSKKKIKSLEVSLNLKIQSEKDFDYKLLLKNEDEPGKLFFLTRILEKSKFFYHK